MRRRATVLSAFTGTGGLDLGLEYAGFDTIACIEMDPAARSTIEHNRPAWNVLAEGNIITVARELEPRHLKLRRRELAVLAGGPPCQPFSKAAQWAPRGRSGLADPRSKCLDAFLALAERFLPKAILIENVPGFVKGRTSALPLLEAALSGINERNGTSYRLECRLLNAADYGVPQRRTRAILVAMRDGRSIEWPLPTHAQRPVRAYDALWDVAPKEQPKMSGYWGNLLASIPEGWNYLHHARGGLGTPLFGRRRRFWSFLLKLSRSEPAWTISAKPGPATGPFHWDSRPLTVTELKRLQSFPKMWAVLGRPRAQVRQIGNATPPLLAEVVGRALGKMLFGTAYRGRPELTISRKRVEFQELDLAPVPPEYLKHLNQDKDHPGEGKGPGALRREAAREAGLAPGCEDGRSLLGP